MAFIGRGSTSYTPVLSFGGATTGITYSVQSGVYYQYANLCYVQIRIILTSKGTATGNANITVPVACSQLSILPVSAGNLTFTGYCHFNPNNLLLQQSSSGAIVANLTDTAFANDTTLLISGAYFT